MIHVFKVLLIALVILAVPATTIHPGADRMAHTVTPSCTYSFVTANVINQTNATIYGDWIKKLSGVEPVTVGGQPYTITTRYSPSLFDPNPADHSKAFEYLKEQVLALYPASQVEVDEYTTPSFDHYLGGKTWQNLIVTIPGKVHPEQVVIMSAHFDSTTGNVAVPPYPTSPGADDNASGSASLLEAARLLRDLPLNRTVKLIWFTGEELGMWGSTSYVQNPNHDFSGVVGVVNLDMFGYDGDNDRCFEMHVSPNPADAFAGASNAIGQCMASAIKNYGLNLHYDYITSGATTASDHFVFWLTGIGAIEIGENFSVANNTLNGCNNTVNDMNPYYHRASDTFDNMNLPFALDISKAALATVIDLANGYSSSLYLPLLTNNFMQ